MFELLLNADDAARSGGKKSAPYWVTFVVTEQSLLIANEGQAFRKENVKSICTLGEPSKDPRKTIGYKGLGFKAVKELTHQLQVVSPPYQFAFHTERARKAEV